MGKQTSAAIETTEYKRLKGSVAGVNITVTNDPCKSTVHISDSHNAYNTFSIEKITQAREMIGLLEMMLNSIEDD